MPLDQVGVGDAAPDVLNAVIEIPASADPVKYEVDKQSGTVFVDRFINVPMHYPCNYGFVPQTLSEDGDPLDVLVITPVAVMTGSVVPCRPLGALDMRDESGRDLKLVAVPAPNMNSGYDAAESVADLPENLRAQIEHFFNHYKKLEPGKWVEISGWLDKETAIKEIVACMERHQK